MRTRETKKKKKRYRIKPRGIVILTVLAIVLVFGLSAMGRMAYNAVMAGLDGKEEGDAIAAAANLNGQAVQADAGAGKSAEDVLANEPKPDIEKLSANHKTRIVVSEPEPYDILVLVNKTNPISADYEPHTLMQVSDYTPGKDEAYSYGRPELVAAFDKLQQAAKADGMNIFVSNAYRSYAVQKSTFESNVKAKGSVEEANKTSAKPGESEHQTGLAMDLTTKEIGYAVKNSFKDTKEGKWIAENCYKYGFIIRFPLGKEDVTGYSYEPWHIRYVGEAVAKTIYEKGWTLEEFLETISSEPQVKDL